MNQFFWVYLIAWLVFCAAAFVVFVRDPRAFSLASPEYRRFLFVPWKLISFSIAFLGIVLIAPYTGDPTWDYFDASFMAALTFLTAPWSVGTLYLAIRHRRCDKRVLLALCLWLFSASWSYDLYLLLRDGHYPHTWFANIFASSVLYCSAGLLWNLEWRAGKGATFGFLEPEWFTAQSGAQFKKILWIAFPFMLLASIAILSFVV